MGQKSWWIKQSPLAAGYLWMSTENARVPEGKKARFEALIQKDVLGIKRDRSVEKIKIVDLWLFNSPPRVNKAWKVSWNKDLAFE